MYAGSICTHTHMYTSYNRQETPKCMRIHATTLSPMRRMHATCFVPRLFSNMPNSTFHASQRHSSVHGLLPRTTVCSKIIYNEQKEVTGLLLKGAVDKPVAPELALDGSISHGSHRGVVVSAPHVVLKPQRERSKVSVHGGKELLLPHCLTPEHLRIIHLPACAREPTVRCAAIQSIF
jgi:hypothetical protein